MNDATLEDAFVRGFYNIPDDDKLKQMSLVEFVTLSWQSEKGSPRQLMIAQEITRRTSRTQFWQDVISNPAGGPRL